MKVTTQALFKRTVPKVQSAKVCLILLLSFLKHSCNAFPFSISCKQPQFMSISWLWVEPFSSITSDNLPMAFLSEPTNGTTRDIKRSWIYNLTVTSSTSSTLRLLARTISDKWLRYKWQTDSERHSWSVYLRSKKLRLDRQKILKRKSKWGYSMLFIGYSMIFIYVLYTKHCPIFEGDITWPPLFTTDFHRSMIRKLPS